MFLGIIFPSLIALMGGILTYKYIDEVNKRQGFVQVADDFREHALELRRNEKNFFHYKNVQHFKNLINALNVITDTIKTINVKTSEEIGKENFSSLDGSLRTYLDLLNDLYLNYQQEKKVVEEVRAEGRKLETFIANGSHAKELTTSFILHLRLLEKNYMIFRDKSSYNKLNTGLSNLRNITPICSECLPYIRAVKGLFKTYTESDSIANNIQSAGSIIEKTTVKMAVREREKISSFIKRTQRLLVIALTLLCTLGPLLVYKTAKKIVAPINRLAEITKKIASGDMSLRAPIREHDETYALATSFNTMLDKLQLTYISLEKSMDLLKEKQAQLVESEKRASMGLLVSGVAHELNNPLNNISLTTETIIEDLEELNPEELKDNLHDILSQSYRAHDIVENLLDFARARRSTDMEKLDITKVVKGTVKLVANQIRISSVNLVQDIPDTPLYIKGNLSKLEQIFVNIIINAIQAMTEEGTLSVSVRPDEENRNVLVKISDTGPGIPEENLKDIFEPFFTTKAVGKGTGLGLSVSRGLAIDHEGEIDVESKVGEGTAFTIKIPLYEKSA